MNNSLKLVFKNTQRYLFGAFLLLVSGTAFAGTVTITVNWPEFPEDNNVLLQQRADSSSSWNTVYRFCPPNNGSDCTTDFSYSATKSTTVTTPGQYRIVMRDESGFGWVAGSSITVVHDGSTVYSSPIDPIPTSGHLPSGVLFTIPSGPPVPVDCGTSTTSGFATSGSGAYKPMIFWFEWGGCGGSLSSGGVYNKVWQITPEITFEGTLTVNSGSAEPYITGTWGGDMLDDLYGGVNPIGLKNPASSNGVNFSLTFDFLLKINGVTVPAVIVTAPAEDLDTDGSTTEKQILTTNGLPWELLEIPSGTNLDLFYSAGNQTIELQDLLPNAQQSTIILASENATQITATIEAGGEEAIAFGVFLGLDFGDAPASYGTAAHYDILRPQSSSKPTTYTDATTLSAASIVFDPIRLGTLNTDAEDTAKSSADATGDDTDNTDDEDGVAPISDLHGDITSYTLNVTCGDTQKVVGWIDWDSDGNFSQAKDKSVETNCASGSATLVWNNLTGISSAKTTFLRVRTSSSAGVSSPTDAVVSGEAEDYQITILAPSADMAVSKTSVSGTYTPGANDTYTIIVTNDGPSYVTGATIADTLPAGVTLRAAWTCTATGTSSCSAASGGTIGGNSVSLTADIKDGESVTVTVPIRYSDNPAVY